MGGLSYKASLPLAGIAVPLFALFLAIGFELMLELSALITLSLSLGISITFPTIELGIAICLQMILMFNLALSLNLPSFALNLALSLDFELVLVLGFKATLELLINAIAGVNLVAYGWLGPGADLGANLNNVAGSGWADGTPPEAPIKVVLFVATTSGAHPPDQLADLSLVAPPPPPPAPTNPPPPAGAYPPPQCYEAGLAGVTIAPPPPGGTQATGTVTVDNSVATGIGKITAVNIVDHGSGYTSAPTITITDTVDIVSAAVASPIVVTLPHALTIPVGQGFGVTIQSVLGSTPVLGAAPLPPVAPPAGAPPGLTVIVITVASTAGLVTASIPPGTYGLQGLNGTWYAKALSASTAELWADAAFSIPSSGAGTYTPSSAKLSGNICGLQNAKVLSPTTIALYSDAALTVPVAGYGTYQAGTVTGAGTGAAATCTMGGGATNALQSFINGLPWPSTEGLAGGVIQFSVMLSIVFDLMKLLLGNLEARASILAGAKASVKFMPPSVAASLELLAKISANLTANLNVKLPSISASASAALSAQIAALAAITGQIAFFLGMSKAGLGLELEIWEYNGPGSQLGAAIAAGPGSTGWHDGNGPGVPVVAGVFGLTTAASQTAFATFFAGA